MIDHFPWLNIALLKLKLKIWYLLPQRNKNNMSGQTLVEFLLLLMVITGISMVFMRVTNQGLARLWIGFVKIIIDNPIEAAKIDI